MSVPSPKDGSVSSAAAVRTGSKEMDALVGTVISDRFRVISPIARGGMGVVYKAEQAPLGRVVAIKILSLKQDEDKDPEFRRRFFLEAATVAKLTHPNTVTVFDYGQSDGGVFYIAMEYVDGRTLKKALSAEGPFEPARAINIAKQIARSLREAHRLGVIHRDLKPGNVMLVDRDGEDYVKVLDFGLVKEVDGDAEEDLTQAGVFMGSPKYMAPEQIQGEAVDGRTDIYAIGCLLYEMLTGHVPFNRENPMQILMDHVREPVPPMEPPEGRPAIPVELQAIVFKCLEKKKEDRFADMEALLGALKTGGVDVGLSMSSSSRMVPLSGELGTGTGEHGIAAAGTPVSGIHTVNPPEEIPISMSTPPPAPSRAWMGVAAVVVFAAVLGGAYAATQREPPPAPIASVPPPLPTSPPTPVATPPGDPVVGTGDPTPPIETPEPIRTVLLSIRSTPGGAMVRLGDREFGPTPTQVELTGEQAADGAEIEMVFTRSGYRDTTLTETVHGDSMVISARLAPIYRGGGGGGGTTGGSGGGGIDTHVDGYRESPY